MADAERRVKDLIVFLDRVQSYAGMADEGSGHPDLRQTKETAGHLEDDVEWLEKGLAEWRTMYVNQLQETMRAKATSKVAIRHIRAMTDPTTTLIGRREARIAALDWLGSIGQDGPGALNSDG